MRNPESEPILRTARLKLRPLRATDAASLAVNADNIRIWENLRDSFPHPYTEADARAFITFTQAKPSPEELAIVIDGQAVGVVGIRPQCDIERFSAEIGYWIGEKYWNRGLVSEALEAFIAYIFDNAEIRRLFAPVFIRNEASARVLEKAGFRRVGEMRRAAFKNGTFIDMYLYERLKS